MKELTTRERVKLIVEHKEADRCPIIDNPWPTAVERWEREGMPKGADFQDFFGMDKYCRWHICDNSPLYPQEVVEETDEYIIKKSKWGVTLKNWKHAGSTPEFIDFTITSRDAWEKAKARMMPSRDRIEWDYLKANYKKNREAGAWMGLVNWFGFDVTHSWMVGTERVLMALVEDPEWMQDMFKTHLELNLSQIKLILDEGYKFDEIFWYDDMGYKYNQFFSLDMYRALLKPFHKQCIDFAHANGMKAHLHSCGDIMPFVPDLVGMGLDMLNPLEVKAGMDPEKLKNEFGDKLTFMGGLNAMYYKLPQRMWDEMHRLIPMMKKSGGYIVATDHSIPDSVSLTQFQEFMRLAKELGKY